MCKTLRAKGKKQRNQICVLLSPCLYSTFGRLVCSCTQDSLNYPETRTSCTSYCHISEAGQSMPSKATRKTLRKKWQMLSFQGFQRKYNVQPGKWPAKIAYSKIAYSMCTTDQASQLLFFFRGGSFCLDTTAFLVEKILHKIQILQEQRNHFSDNIFSEQYRQAVLLLLIFSIWKCTLICFWYFIKCL